MSDICTILISVWTHVADSFTEGPNKEVVEGKEMRSDGSRLKMRPEQKNILQLIYIVWIFRRAGEIW